LLLLVHNCRLLVLVERFGGSLLVDRIVCELVLSYRHVGSSLLRHRHHLRYSTASSDRALGILTCNWLVSVEVN
jgi:hypothetical protein